MLFLFYFFTIKTLKPRTPPLSLHHGKFPLLLPPQHDLPSPWDKVFSPRSSKFKFRDTIFSKFANILQKCQTSVLASSSVGPPLVTKLLCPSLTKHWHFLRWTRETTIWFIFFGHWIWTQAWPRRNEVTLKRKKVPTFVYFIGRVSLFIRFDSLIQAWVVKVFSLLSEVGQGC